MRTFAGEMFGCMASGLLVDSALAQGRDPKLYPELSRSVSAQMEAAHLKDPFKGTTTNGAMVQGLFPIRHTDIDTRICARRRFCKHQRPATTS
ncbi:MAG: hypothetical protein RLZZ200_2499 [Pseudomonadota bacterium]|jgi:hypothetical protein